MGTKNPDKDNNVYLSISFYDDGSDAYDLKEPDFHYWTKNYMQKGRERNLLLLKLEEN
jgi:hypothetical protein